MKLGKEFAEARLRLQSFGAALMRTWIAAVVALVAGAALAQSPRDQFLNDLAAQAAGFKVIRGGTVLLTGKQDSPLWIVDAKVMVAGFESTAQIRMTRCEVEATGWTASTTKDLAPARFEDCTGTVSGSVFDAKGFYDDAVIVGPSPEFWTAPRRYAYLWPNGGETPESHPSWTWFERRSDRTGELKRFGIDLKAFGRSPVFEDCEFKNAGQAGIFALYVKGFVVRNSRFFNTGDSRLSVEWCYKPVVEGNTFSNLEGQKYNNGLTLHYYNWEAVIRGNDFDGTNLILSSASEPQKALIDSNKNVGFLHVFGGQQFGWKGGAWSDTTIIANQAEGIEVTGINWGEGLRDFMPATFIAGNTVGSRGIRLGGVTGWASENTVTGARNAVQVDVRFGFESVVRGSGNTLDGKPSEIKRVDFGGVLPETPVEH